MIKQHTLKKSISFTGLGVHTGNSVNVTLKPLPENSGFVINRVDEDFKFNVYSNKIVSNNRNTTLGKKGVNVQTIEHFMFAFYKYGISNVEIQIDAEEFPVFDGSSSLIVEKIAEVGVVEQSEYINEIIVDKKIEIIEGDSSAIIEPSDKFELDLTIDFPAKEIGIANYKYTDGDDLTEITKARTFVLLSEINYLLQNGMSQIKDINCALIVKNIELTQKLTELMMDRFECSKEDVELKLEELDRLANGNERYIPETLIKHKVLDFLGDLYLTCSTIRGKITISKPGHLINGKIAQTLFNEYC